MLNKSIKKTSPLFSLLQQQGGKNLTKKNLSTSNGHITKEFGIKHVARGISRNTNLIFSHGKGSYLWMEDGKKFLDFTAGIGVTCLGHCEPSVTKAAQKQVETLVHGQVNRKNSQQ